MFKKLIAKLFPATLLLTVLMMGVGYLLADSGGPQTVKIAIFLAFNLLIFHLLFRAFRKRSSERDLRTVEYLYLSLALLAVAGVLEFQSAYVEFERGRVIAGHMPYEGFAELPYCKARESGDVSAIDPQLLEKHHIGRLCRWQTAFSEELNTYDHKSMRNFIDNTEWNFGPTPPEPIAGRIEVLKKLWDEMEATVNRYKINTTDRNWVLLKLYAFYLLALGLAIRIGKLSADVFGWRIKVN